MQPIRSVRSPLLIALGITLGACGEDTEDNKKYPPVFEQTDSSVAEGGCDGEDFGTVENRVRYQAAKVEMGAECVKQDQTRTCQDDGTWTVWSGDYTVESCQVGGLANCDGMPHGTPQTRPRFETMTAAKGSLCKKQDQMRVCEDGTWSAWSGTYTFETCTVDGAASCGTSPHGTIIEETRYENAVVPFGTMCKSELQTKECKNGTWSTTGTYKEANCRVRDAQSCGNIPHGQDDTRERWKSSLVEANETCQSEKQTSTCNNGTPGKWTGTFEALFCDVKGKRRCENGENDIPHGESGTRTFYESALVDFGKECVSVKQTQLCKDGTFDPWTPNTTFTATSCTVRGPRPCGATPHNGTQTRLAYKEAAPKFGTPCESANQTSTCFNGVWSDYVGPAGYAALTCAPQQPKACGTVAHNGTTTRRFYEQTEVEYGATCKSEVQTGRCFDGTLTFTGPYTAADCKVLPAESCDSTKDTNQSRDRFASLTVVAGRTCNKQVQTRTCTNNKWTAWTGTFTATTCKVLGRSCSRGFGAADILDGENDTRVRYEAPFPATACKPETQTNRCNDGRFAGWSGTFDAVGCSPLPAAAAGVASCREPNNDEPKCRQWTGTNLDSNKGACTGTSVWDNTRGCPTEGTAIGKCTGVTGLNGVVSSNFSYVPTLLPPRGTCLGTGGTWTDL